MASATQLLVCAGVFATACRPSELHPLPDASNPPPPRCGDGTVQPPEQCDGTDLDGGTCVLLGFDQGTLSCASNCTYDTSHCVKLCGNGVLDPGEQCDGKLGVPVCVTWGFNQCTPQCKLDTSQCVTSAYVPGIPFPADPGGYSILAAIQPGPGASLVSASPSFQRLDVYGYDLAKGFQLTRRLLEGGTPLLPFAADVNGDGFVDLAAINIDGTADRYTFVPASNTFALSPIYPDAGSCPAVSWVGAGHFEDGGAADLMALACAPLLLPGGATAGAARFPFDGGATAAALADFNGDGLTDFLEAVDGGVAVFIAAPPAFQAGPFLPWPLVASSMGAADLDGDGNVDVVASDGVSIQVFQNVDGGLVQRRNYSASPVALRVVDLDLDGAPDIVWLDASGVHVRRNLGSFTFSIFDFALDAGVPLSLAVGDIDGNGSPDLAVVYSLGGTATLTDVLLNTVK